MNFSELSRVFEAYRMFAPPSSVQQQPIHRDIAKVPEFKLQTLLILILRQFLNLALYCSRRRALGLLYSNNITPPQTSLPTPQSSSALHSPTNTHNFQELLILFRVNLLSRPLSSLVKNIPAAFNKILQTASSPAPRTRALSKTHKIALSNFARNLSQALAELLRIVQPTIHFNTELVDNDLELELVSLRSLSSHINQLTKTISAFFHSIFDFISLSDHELLFPKLPPLLARTQKIVADFNLWLDSSSIVRCALPQTTPAHRSLAKSLELMQTSLHANDMSSLVTAEANLKIAWSVFRQENTPPSPQKPTLQLRIDPPPVPPPQPLLEIAEPATPPDAPPAGCESNRNTNTTKITMVYKGTSSRRRTETKRRQNKKANCSASGVHQPSPSKLLLSELANRIKTDRDQKEVVVINLEDEESEEESESELNSDSALTPLFNLNELKLALPKEELP